MSDIILGHTGYDGSAWIKRSLKVENISPLGEAVANILGRVYQGIYHLSTHSLLKVEWSNPRHIQFTLDRELATYDNNELTRLVIICHDFRIRLSIAGASYRYMHLGFSQRKQREGGSAWDRHPTIEAAVARYRELYGPIEEDNELKEYPAKSATEIYEEAKQSFIRAGEQCGDFRIAMKIAEALAAIRKAD